MKDYEKLPLIPIKKAKGIYLYDYEDNAYIDSISSWWVNIFGHSNEYINEKLKEQVENLEHVILTCFTHEPIVKLSERLVKLTPKGLEKVFWADNGSSAIEVALKMSYQYFKNKGEDRPCFISLKNSYHGETLGALAVGDVGLYKDTFDTILLKTMQVKVPKDKSFEATCSAFMTLSKGLTGGYLPLSCVLTTNKVYDEFYCDYTEYKAFLHSHSYTGNPLSCAVANATLDLFEKENVIKNNRVKIDYMSKKLEKFKELDCVENLRQTGMVVAMDIKGYKPNERIGLKIFDFALKEGVFLRPLGNTLYFMPPFVITLKEIDKMMDTAYEALKSL